MELMSSGRKEGGGGELVDLNPRPLRGIKRLCARLGMLWDIREELEGVLGA